MQQAETHSGFSPFTTRILFVVLIIIGAAMIPLLNIQLKPKEKDKRLFVSFRYPGALPLTVEKNATAPLEAVLNSMSNIQEIYSKSYTGKGEIELVLKKETDMQKARFEASMLIKRVFPQLPQQVSYPAISLSAHEENSSMLLSYAVSSEAPPAEIMQKAGQVLLPRLALVEGITQAKLYGAPTRQWNVYYNRKTAETLGITPIDLQSALNRYSEKKALGKAHLGDQTEEFFVWLRQSPNQKEPQWDKIPVGERNGKIIFLDEIAYVKKAEASPQSYFRINGRNSIYLVIYASEQSNQIALAKQVKKKITEAKNFLPPGFLFSKSYDSSASIASELRSVFTRTLFTVGILLLFVLLVYRSFSYLLLISLTLIANLLLAVILYKIFAIDIHLYSLAGITISLGLIIDNVIIMGDHLRHHGNRRIFIPLLAATLTTVGALCAVFFLDVQLKQNLTDFVIVLAANLSVSLIVALFLIPAIIKLLPDRAKNTRKSARNKRKIVLSYKMYEKIIRPMLKRKVFLYALAIWAFGVPLFLLPGYWEGGKWYHKVYNNTLGNTWYKENIRPATDKYLGGAFRLFSLYVFDAQNFYRRNEQTRLYVYASNRRGATLNDLNRTCRTIENYLSEFSEIQKYTTNITTNGNASIVIEFDPEFENTLIPAHIYSQLISYAVDFGGVNWNIFGLGDGFSQQKGEFERVTYRVKLFGYNFEELNRQAERMRKKLLKHPRIQKVNNFSSADFLRRKTTEQLTFLPNKALAFSHGISIKDLNQSIVQNRSISASGVYSEKNGFLPVRLLPQKTQNDLWNLKNAPLMKNIAPLRYGKLQSQIAAMQIDKENQQYLRLLEYDYIGSSKFGDQYLKQVSAEMQNNMPIGYTIEKLPMFLIPEKMKKNYALIFFVLLVVFSICAILFESFSKPFVIIASIPFAFVGLFITYYFFDIPFGLGGFASFFLLAGLTVNASIYFVNDFHFFLKKTNQPPLKAYIKAFQTKILPVFLTFVSTGLGLLPFLWAQEPTNFWFGLAAGSIGGLTFAMLALLFYLPLFLLKPAK